MENLGWRTELRDLAMEQRLKMSKHRKSNEIQRLSSRRLLPLVWKGLEPPPRMTRPAFIDRGVRVGRKYLMVTTQMLNPPMTRMRG